MEKYTIYKITNTFNGKIYIGAHKTKDINDSYMSSSDIVRSAIQKYGKESFKKEILHVFDNPAEMFDKEAEIVNEEFVLRKDTYNVKRGGFGGWNHINTGDSEHRNRARKGGRVNQQKYKNLKPFVKGSERAKAASKKANDLRKKNGLTEEHKLRISETRLKNSEKYRRNWVKDPLTGSKKFVKRDEIKSYVERGWIPLNKKFLNVESE